MTTFNVLIADDRRLFADGLKELLHQVRASLAFCVVGMAESGQDLVDIFSQCSPNLLLLNLHLGKPNEAIEALQSLQPLLHGTQIIGFCQAENLQVQRDAARYGVAVYLTDYCSSGDLFSAIETVTLGSHSLFGNTHHLEMPPKSSSAKMIQKYRLTSRELEIIQLLAQAMSNKEIGKELFISDQTVGVHRKNVMRKLNVNSVTGLLKLAYEHRLV